MTDERDWLDAERAGDDALAEAMFARVVADMPAVEPSPGFVSRTVQAAWRRRERRRMAERIGILGAALLLAVATLTLLYSERALAVGPVAGYVTLFSHGFIWLVAWIGREAKWWGIAERIGIAISSAIGSGSMVAVVAAAETIVLLSLYAIRRLILNNEMEKSRTA